MQTIKGTLKNLRTVKTDSKEDPYKIIFTIDNNIIEFDANKPMLAKNGDEVVVAGHLGINRNIFMAYSYKKIT
ncbi:MAG: hypothetical protein L3J53_00085 [Proteobacteria bacterium]|nr:hypothetical protein [Pseudomonadota bacterium]